MTHMFRQSYHKQLHVPKFHTRMCCWVYRCPKFVNMGYKSRLRNAGIPNKLADVRPARNCANNMPISNKGTADCHNSYL